MDQQPSHLLCWQVLENSGAETRCMPMWLLPELQGALHLFPGVTKDRLHELHLKWGGTIRWCLQNALKANNQQQLNAGIARTDISAMIYEAVADKVRC